MTSYKIFGWNGLLIKNNHNPYPTIYINPNPNFNRYAKDNNYQIKVKIEGTNHTSYDENTFLATVSSSGEVPNDRPNFYKQTGWLILTLECPWYGYPPKLGKIVIEDLPVFGSTNYKDNTYNNTYSLQSIDAYNKAIVDIVSGMETKNIVIIICSICIGIPLLIFLILGGIYICSNKK
jgi:hypothetical protein